MKTTHTNDPVVEKDLILVHVNDQPAFYARIEEFEPAPKPKWWQVKLLALLIPPQRITWILRREQINGEPFTMGGAPMRIEKVRVPKKMSNVNEKDEVQTSPPRRKSSPSFTDTTRQARILSMRDNKGKR